MPPELSSSTKSAFVWRNAILFSCLHLGAFYGLYLIQFSRLATICWAIILGIIGGLGITAGSHRLWAHKAYRARWPLRLTLSLFQTLAFQNHIFEWVRDHRVHHKFTDTNADPHNSKRGLFFSHIGWLMMRKHRDVVLKGKTIDMSDLEKDWVVMFQKKYYPILLPLICFIFPTWVPWYFWNENVWISWYVAAFLRYTVSLHFTWLINSAAHVWGTRPYDKNISSAENIIIAVLTLGEGWHNYHHAFPWDYKTSQSSAYGMNWTTGFLDLMAKIGWAYDFKSAPVALVERRAQRTGDGAHVVVGPLWGWDDLDLTEEDRRLATVTNRAK